MQIGLDKRRTSDKPLFGDENEWEIKTISSAVKTFLRNLPEPLMTFDLHHQFINAAKMDSTMRVSHIHFYVHQLPKTHFDMLKMVIKHLRKVADHDNENKMTVGNLGVCFGPTLLRPKEETNAAILDIKFCNVVVEVLIANYDTIFNTEPRQIGGLPCPPKPGHVPEEKNETIVSIKSPSLSPLNKKLVLQTFIVYCDYYSKVYGSPGRFGHGIIYHKSGYSTRSNSALNSKQAWAHGSTKINYRVGKDINVPFVDYDNLTGASFVQSLNTFESRTNFSRRVKTLYECTAGHDSELSFQPGQIITNVYESKEEGWLVGTLNGKTGLIPANYVEPLP
uniref:SH3 domain-containing protein n=1 Tax=Syphacia muris TaxID=451379 RepID=A0A158R5N7_9BILA